MAVDCDVVDGCDVVVDDGWGGGGGDDVVVVVVVEAEIDEPLPTISFSEFVGRIWLLMVFTVELLGKITVPSLVKRDEGIAAGIKTSWKSVVETICFCLVPTFSEPLNRGRNKTSRKKPRMRK